MLTVFKTGVTLELGKDVRDTWGLWGASTALFLVPGDGYKGNSLYLFVLSVGNMHSCVHILYFTI